jgi:hypothetical protein
VFDSKEFKLKSSMLLLLACSDESDVSQKVNSSSLVVAKQTVASLE